MSKIIEIFFKSFMDTLFYLVVLVPVIFLYSFFHGGAEQIGTIDFLEWVLMPMVLFCWVFSMNLLFGILLE